LENLSFVDTRKTANTNGLARRTVSGPGSAVNLQQVGKCNSIESPNAAILAGKAENESSGYISTPPETNASIRSLGRYSLLDGPVDGMLSPASNTSCKPETTNNSVLSNVASTDIPNGCLTTVDSGQQEASDSHSPVEFTQYFQEGYCKISELDDCRELTEAVTDADSSSSHCEREKPEEDGDNDDLLGGVFAFSEEGSSHLFFSVIGLHLSTDMHLLISAPYHVAG